LIKTEPELAEKARGVISKQLAVGVACAVFFYFYQDGWAALSAMYGCLVCMATTLLLLWGISRASKAAADNPGKSMTILYVGAAQRFVLVLALLGGGLALLKLNPVAVLVGFALTQISAALSGRGQSA